MKLKQIVELSQLFMNETLPCRSCTVRRNDCRLPVSSFASADSRRRSHLGRMEKANETSTQRNVQY